MLACGRSTSPTRRISWDRVAATQQDVASRDVTPDLAETDRALLANTLRDLEAKRLSTGARPSRSCTASRTRGTMLKTKNGPLFMDFSRILSMAPSNSDLAWVPKEVSERYPDADQALVGEFRGSYWR